MKFYRYKQLQRLTFFGYDDIYRTNASSLSRKSPQSRTVEIPAVPAVIAAPAIGPVAAVLAAAGPPIVLAVAAIPYTEAIVGVPAIPAIPPPDNDTKVLRFNLNKLYSAQLSQNAKIVIEQLYLPGFDNPRTGPITIRMHNLNTHSYDSQNNGYSSTLIYTTEAGDTNFKNHSPEMLYNFSISQNFFQNGYIEFELTYPDIEIDLENLERFYITLVVYDIDEQDLLLKDTPDVDFKNFGPHIAFQHKN